MGFTSQSRGFPPRNASSAAPLDADPHPLHDALAWMPSVYWSARASLLFKSTIATSAPLSMHAWLITRPSPRAPPVMTHTRFSSEKLASVRLKCIPPRPEMGWLGGWDSSSGCLICTLLSVREKAPAWTFSPSMGRSPGRGERESSL